MLYNNLLKHGHWEPFVQLLWSRKNNRIPLSDWLRQARNKEDESLLDLFEQDIAVLMQYVKDYFAVRNTQEKCQRCNESFHALDKNNCQLCGWDFSVPSQPADRAIKAGINAKFVEALIENIEAKMTFEKLDREARFWSEQVEHVAEHTQQLKEEIEAERIKATFEQNKSSHLEHQISAQSEQIRQFEMMLRNAESLFQPYEDHTSSHTIELVLKGHYLHAIARPPVVFPIDLIMGVQKITDGPPVKTINKTCCFVFIHENQWEKLSSIEWKVDLSEIARGKIQGEFYLNILSHLHKKDHKANIRYEIKRITFV